MRSAWKSWALGIFFVVLFTTLRLATLVGGQAGSTQEPFRGDPENMLRVDGTRGPVDLGLMDPALVGAIDIHEHLGPAPRFTNQKMSIDVFDEAKLAKRRGMRGFVFNADLVSIIRFLDIGTRVQGVR